MKKINTSVFVKYVISYSISFIVPLFILGSIMIFLFSHLLKDEINKSLVDKLSSTRSVIDSRIQEMNNAALQISSIPSLKYDSKGSFTEAIEVVNFLRNEALTNKFYDNIFLYYKDSDYIFSATSTYRVNDFFEQIYPYENWSTNSFLSDVNTMSNVTIRPAERLLNAKNGTSKYITYIVPIPYGSKQPTGLVFFIIDEKNFGQNLEDTLRYKNANVIIFDSDGKEILSVNNESVATANFLDKRILEEDTYSFRQRINGSPYTISSIESNLSGLKYVVMLPINEINQKIMPLLYIALIGFLVVLLVGSAVVYLLAKTNYKPINDLVNLSKSAFHDAANEVSKDKNEIDTIKTTVNKMTGVISILQKKVETSIPSVRNTVLSMLIRGHYSNVESFNKDAESAGISLNGNLFNILIILFHNKVDIKNLEFSKILEDLNGESLSSYCIDSIAEDRLAIIVSSKNTNDTDFDNFLSNLFKMLQYKCKVECSIGIGKSVNSLDMVGSSYIQASAALDYRFMKGKNTLIHYNEIENLSVDIHYYPKEKLEALGLNILKGETSLVLCILSDIFNEAKTLNLPVFFVRSLSYTIINTIYDSMQKLKSTINPKEYKYSDVTSLAKAETIDELSIHIGRFSVFICSVITQSQLCTEKCKIDSIKEFVDSNFTASDFSLQKVADTFGMSPPKLSAYFKNNSGENISNYVNRLRVEYAKKLLCETDDSLQTIVNKIGYLNVSSFIRMFKEYTNTTPGEYRQLLKKD